MTEADIPHRDPVGNGTNVLFVRMSADEYERLRAAARADDRTISQAARVAIRAYLQLKVG